MSFGQKILASRHLFPVVGLIGLVLGFIARINLRSMQELDTILDRISERAQTNTSLVKATSVKRRLPPLA